MSVITTVGVFASRAFRAALAESKTRVRGLHPRSAFSRTQRTEWSSSTTQTVAELIGNLQKGIITSTCVSPGTELTSIQPWCREIMDCVIDRPIPEPCGLPDTIGKILSLRSAGIPGPLSSTRRRMAEVTKPVSGSCFSDCSVKRDLRVGVAAFV